jgi:hypothetical protein
MGLYGGERARDIGARKGLGNGQHILDYMGSEELADNIFRAAQTEAKIRRDGIDNKAGANKAHFDMGRAVRSFILEQGERHQKNCLRLNSRFSSSSVRKRSAWKRTVSHPSSHQTPQIQPARKVKMSEAIQPTPGVASSGASQARRRDRT